MCELTRPHAAKTFDAKEYMTQARTCKAASSKLDFEASMLYRRRPNTTCDSSYDNQGGVAIERWSNHSRPSLKSPIMAGVSDCTCIDHVPDGGCTESPNLISLTLCMSGDSSRLYLSCVYGCLGLSMGQEGKNTRSYLPCKSELAHDD
jgi:hypothetical protein